ncbi:GC-rich sequence DNA-binding factor-like protein-domain-containing protein [Parachaetomium inaequale]|uniref:GC-rich sequence DNA-binding factor-like protein-domain-containing protein n=1 Tax=Parachaetomium inaequale TaxID=2588326 RepID=A0AAN6PE44_9PEZI|nr:GC-rich sequence DNA-binding factor-like protein-domain-containing protein [Parachaetomium inaequale]
MARLDEMRFDPARLNKASAADYSSSESDAAAADDDEYLMPSRNPHDSEFADHNPRKRRRTGRDAKESAALGIFGSESEDDGPGRTWKHKSLRNKGVSFVSSAKAKPDSDDEDDEENEDEYDDANPGAVPAEAEEDEDEDEEMGGVGLGFQGAPAGAGHGLGWTPPTQQEIPAKRTVPPPKSFVKSKFDSANPLGNGFTPMSERGPTLLVRDDEPATPRAAMPSAFTQTKGGKTKINAKSFGARMMAKMGYVEGKGLGKEEQGRNLIIEANLRPQKAGLGAVREKTEQERQEEKRQARLRGEEVVDSEEEKKKKAARRKKALAGGISSGAGSGATTPRRQKPKYLTMDEIKKAAPGLNIPDAFTPILDMTGPGKKMLTSSSGLMTPTAGAAPAEPAGAAENRKLVKRAQNDFMAILEEWQSLQERKAYLELQLKQEQQELEELSASLQGNKSVTVACEAASKTTESGEADRKADLSYRLGRVIAGLGDANSSLSDSMLPQIKDELSSLAVAAIHPLFNQYRQLWEPLEEPKPAFVDGLNSIRGLLGLDHKTKKTYRKPTATPYETMMYELWLRTLTAAVREWNVRDPDQLIAVLDAWDPLLPRFVRAQLLQDITRKLEEALQKWQPKKHTHNLPHRWIFPWLPHLPATHLDPKSPTGLVADVRRKFRQLIDAWDFNRGVIPGLKQWKDVLRGQQHRKEKEKDTWTPLVLNHLLPSMARHLRAHFRVEPRDQAPYAEVLDKVLEWTPDVLRPGVLGEVLVAEVFPAWHAALYQWLLLGEEADYNEIGAWFQWWQDEVFPAEIRALPSVVAEFEKGSAMIERALDLGGGRVASELAPPERGPALKTTASRREREKEREVPVVVVQEAVDAKKAEEVTFREVIEEWCQRHDLQFVPERNRPHAEGPMYRISGLEGKKGVSVYFKGNSLFALVKDHDGPIEIRRDREDDWGTLMLLVS